MSAYTYFGQLSTLWEELHTHKPIIKCSCCVSCNANSEHEAQRENDKLHQFLMGLCLEYYAQVRTNILSKDPLPSLDHAYQMVLQEETIRSAKVSEDKSPEVMSFAVKTSSGRGRGRFDKPDKSHLLCTHCKKSGHDVSQCFEIHGYLEWYENRGNNARGGRSGRGRGVSRANATLTNKFTNKYFSVIIEEAEPSSTNEPNPQPNPSSTPEPTSQPESNLTPEFNSQTERHTSNLVPNNQDQNIEIGRELFWQLLFLKKNQNLLRRQSHTMVGKSL
nr:Retrovirus-related Pol polyprotein from transposon RE2 [Ipomoea batatas]